MTDNESNAVSLRIFAKRIRDLTAKERNTGQLLTTIRLLIREALKSRAFPGPRFTESRDFFVARHDAKPNHNEPLAMLSAFQGLANNGNDVITDKWPKDLPSLRTNGTSYPSRDHLRPHVEIVAYLLDLAAGVLTGKKDVEFRRIETGSLSEPVQFDDRRSEPNGEARGQSGAENHDGQSDTDKKSGRKSKRRMLNHHGRACIAEFKAYRKRGDAQSMQYVVKEYVSGHPEVSEASLYRSLTDNSDQWRPKAG